MAPAECRRTPDWPGESHRIHGRRNGLQTGMAGTLCPAPGHGECTACRGSQNPGAGKIPFSRPRFSLPPFPQRGRWSHMALSVNHHCLHGTSLLPGPPSAARLPVPCQPLPPASRISLPPGSRFTRNFVFPAPALRHTGRSRMPPGTESPGTPVPRCCTLSPGCPSG